MVSDNGVDGTTRHTTSYVYGRDAGGSSYPGPTSMVENLDAAGTTRTTSYTYYPLGDPRQDLPQITKLPSVDVPGNTMTITDTYATSGLLTQRSKLGYVNGAATTYNWRYTYDSRGRLLTMTGPRTDLVQTTKYAYFADTDGDHARAGQQQTVTDALGHITHYGSVTGFTSYDPFGHPQSMTDPNGVGMEYTYDARGRMLTSTLLGVSGDTTNLVSKWAYDGAGRMTSMTRPAGNSLTLAYDTSDRVSTATRTNASNVQYERMALAYNTVDQPTSLAAQGCSSPSTACASWTTTWSAAYAYSPTTSDLLKTINADSTAKQFAYDAQGQLSAFNDENHPSGANYTNTYDLAGRRLSETRLLGTGSVVAKYAYDLHDNVNSVTDQNANVTTYHFDDFDRVTKEVSPVQGTTTYKYDPADNLISTTDSNASTTAYTYDALDRELSEKATKGTTTLTSSWTYDDATVGHYGIGRTATMTDPSGSTTYRYERRGNVVSEARQIVGKNFAQDYSYDLNGNRASIIYPDGRVVAYTYDYADRPLSAVHNGTITPTVITAQAAKAKPALAVPEATANPYAPLRTSPMISLPKSGSTPLHPLGTSAGSALTLKTFNPPTIGSNGTSAASSPITVRSQGISVGTRSTGVRPNLTPSADVYVSSATYLPFGPVTSIAFGNGTVQTLSRNNRYFPTENKLVSGSTMLSDHVYSEDAVGNITAISDALDSGYSRNFAYDDLNRLTTANAGTKLWGTATGNGYAYDAMGNIKTAKLGSVYASTFTYKAGASGSTGLPTLSNVLENGKSRTVTYDAFGNEAGDAVNTFAYSPRELLGSDSTKVSAYYYDANRQRVSTTLKTGNARDSFFDPQQHLVAETAQFTSTTTSPAISEEYVWFGDMPVAQIDGTTTRWTYADHLGTPQIQTDLTGAVQWQAEYEPFGTIETLRKNDVHQPLRFPGQVAEQFDTGANGLTERSFNNARWYRPNWGRYTQADEFGIQFSLDTYEFAKDNSVRYMDVFGMKAFSYDSEFCKSLLETIANLDHEVSKRTGELAEDRLGLPERVAGDRAKPSLSRFGHRMLLNMAKGFLAKARGLYDAYCDDPSGPKSCPATLPQPRPQPAPREQNPFNPFFVPIIPAPIPVPII